MAYREVGMWEILNVLRRIGRGQSQQAVALVTDHDGKTVRRYVRVASELGSVPGVREVDEVLAAEVFGRVRPRGRHKRSENEKYFREVPTNSRDSRWRLVSL